MSRLSYDINYKILRYFNKKIAYCWNKIFTSKKKTLIDFNANNNKNKRYRIKNLWDNTLFFNISECFENKIKIKLKNKLKNSIVLF